MEYRFERFLTGDQIESLNCEIDNTNPKQISFIISEFEGTRLFANSRLLSLLLKCKNNNIVINVIVSHSSSKFFETGKNKEVFLNNTMGYLLSAFANSIHDSEGQVFKDLILSKQREELAKQLFEDSVYDNNLKIKGSLQTGKEITAFFFNQFNKAEKAEIFQKAEFPDTVKEFNSDFSSILRNIGLDLRRNGKKIEDISSNIGFEAVQNINDHALFDLNYKRIEEVQFVHFHRNNVNRYSSKFEYIIEETGTPITEYLKILRNKYFSSSLDKNEVFLFEISFSDSGVGIPAKLASTFDVYMGDIANEKSYLLQALNEGISSKKVNTSAVGFGLPKIMETIKRINGLIVFRTGRLLMYKHFLNKDDTVSLNDWNSHELNYLPGTSVSILFPVAEVKLNSNQPSLF